ncbi:MAG: hypothetical protein IKV16_02855, partial [Clostridia bacterium]|nr:hypothetical protein [Clostridia bacterium]
MKKFITFILAFAVIITAFGVVAFAAAPAPYTYSKNQAGDKLNFDGWTVQENLKTKLNDDGVTTSFISIREDYPGGNKYMYIDGMGSKGGCASWYSQITYSRSTYKVSNYPIVALDFDVMTTNGRFGSTHDSTNFILRPYYYNDLVAETDTNYKKYVQFSSSSVGAAKAVSLGQIKLDNTAYLWQHVTIAYEWISGGTINTFVYVNGSKDPTYTNVNNVSAAYSGKTSDINNTFFGVPYIMAASWGQNSQIRLDNYKQTYFPTGYDLSKVSTYIYNDSYVMPESYKYTVASITDAENNITYYDDLTKAIEATGENNILSLCSDIDTPVAIDKAIKIDTNKYENGEIVGSYNFVYTSNLGFVADIKDGIYNFSKSEQLVTVYWDPACDTACSCNAEYGGHRLTAISENVAKDAPLVYTGTLPTFKIENGVEKRFLGWSYENDGTVDTLVPVTDKQIADGAIYLYPVYSSTQYSFEVTTSAGTYYFLEGQFTNAMSKVEAGGTIKLWTDVTVEKGYTLKTAGATIVLDLNGHDYKRFSYYNRHYSATYDECAGKWVKGSRITSTTVNDKNETVTSNVESGYAGSAFAISASNINFTIKNSGAPAEIFTYTLYRDSWHDENGSIVGFDNLCETRKVGGNQNSGTVLFSYTGAKNTVITIDGNGITYYGACLVLNEWGGNQNTNTFNINGGTYYSIVNTYLALIAQLAGGYLNVNDAVIVTNNSCFVRVADQIGSTTKHPITVADFRFTNCIIITSGTQNANTLLGNSAITLENCYYYNAELHNNNLTFKKGNYINASLVGPSLEDGTTQITKTVQKSFNLIKETGFVLDENAYPTFKFTMEDKLFTFDYYVADIDTECVIVNWIDTEGYLLDSTYALKNEVVSIPYLKVPSGDGWRAVTNVSTWLDENGNISNLLLGDKAEYDLFAVLPEESEREYAATVTGAMFNMVYFTNFAYNVYVPKEAGVEITDFGGAVPSRTVWINKVEYWLYTVYAPSTRALDETVISLTYKIDGSSYTATFKPSAIYYANVIVNDPYASKDEKELVGCLIRYIEESYRALNGGSLGAVNGIKLNSFYNVYKPAPYITEYPDADLFDSKPFAGLLYSVNLELESGKVKFVFTLTDEAVALNYSVKAKGLTGALYTEDGKVFTSDNTPLRTHVMEPFTILIVDKNGNTVTVDDGNGGKVEVSSQYSLAAYINATNNNLCKALYAFGTALRVYYPVSSDNYPVKKITLYGNDIKEFTIAADIDSPAEYYAAEQLQAYIYSKSGYWLEIVPSSDATKSIVISLVEKTGGEGFEITFTESRINIVCEFSNLISSEI